MPFHRVRVGLCCPRVLGGGRPVGVRAAPGASVSPRFSAVLGTVQCPLSQESLGPRDALSSPRATSGLGCCPSHSPVCLGVVLTCRCPEQAPSGHRKFTALLPGPLDKGRAPRTEKDCALSGMVTVVTRKGPASPAWGSCLRPALVDRFPPEQEQEQSPALPVFPVPLRLSCWAVGIPAHRKPS